MKKNALLRSVQPMGIQSSYALQWEILQGIKLVASFFAYWGRSSPKRPSAIFATTFDEKLLQNTSPHKRLGVRFAKKLVEQIEQECPLTAIEATFLLDRLLQETLSFCQAGLCPLDAARQLDESLRDLEKSLVEKTPMPLLGKTPKVMLERLIPASSHFPPPLRKALEELSPASSIVLQNQQEAPFHIEQKRGKFFPFLLQIPNFLSHKTNILGRLQESATILKRPFFCFFEKGTLTIETLLALLRSVPHASSLIIFSPEIATNVTATTFFQQHAGVGKIHLLSSKNPLPSEAKEALLSLLQAPRKILGASSGFLEELILQEKRVAIFPSAQESTFPLLTILSLKETLFSKWEPLLQIWFRFFSNSSKRPALPLLLSAACLSYSRRTFPGKAIWRNVAQTILQHPQAAWDCCGYAPTKRSTSDLIAKDLSQQAEKAHIFVPEKVVKQALQATVTMTRTILRLGGVVATP
ncbi:MAG: hypothetical protein AAGI90_05055 [Chlamydiota bacterium]